MNNPEFEYAANGARYAPTMNGSPTPTPAADGTGGYPQFAYGEQGNEMEIELYLSSISPGLVECEVLVFSGEAQDTLITSARFNFYCRRGIANRETVPETDEWPLLVEMVAAENTRQENENDRQEAELARREAERLREEAEAARVEAEQEREQRNDALSVWEAFDPEKAYAPLKKVAYEGSSYLCIAPTTGELPTNAEYWLLIAKKGDKGERGDDGSDGSDGKDGENGKDGNDGQDGVGIIYHTDIVLTAASWVAGKYQIAYEHIAGDSPGDISINQSATIEQYNAWMAAMPQVTAQAPGAITLAARGVAPIINIPVHLEVRT